jgi:ABC-type antimicrobial peptide transport system permease subunit
MVFKNLLRRKTRTLLTTLSIAMGVAALVALGAMAEGFAVNYGSLVSGSDADLLVMQADAMDVAFSSVDMTVAERISGMPDVTEVEGVVHGWMTAGDMSFFIIFGHEPHSRSITHFRATEGSPLGGGRQILLGKAAADALEKAVGDTMRIYGAPYQVVGIFETGQGVEESSGVVSLEEAQKLFNKPRQVSLFQVYLRDIERSEAVRERIEKLFPKLSASLSKDYGLNQDWMTYIKGMAWGIALIAVVVGGLGIMNTMIMTVFERTREIGTLRALGWRRGQVLRMILGEALALSTVGAALGIGMGIGLTRLAARSPGLGAMMAGRYTPTLFAQALATALALGTVGGFYPAWRGANLQPIEALRYEGGAGGGKRESGRGKMERGRWTSVFHSLSSILHFPSSVFRGLWRRRTRTLLTIAGIGVGVATVVALNGIGAGFMAGFNQLSSSGGGDLTLRQADVADTSLSSIDERIGRAIAGMPQVEAVTGMVMGIATSEELPFFFAWGLEPGERGVQRFPLVEGQYIQRPNEMMLGRTATKMFKKKVGDTLMVYNNRYRIVGIFESGSAFEDGAGVLNLREAQRLFGKPRQVSFYQIKVRERDDVEFVRSAIEQRFPEVSVSLSTEFAENTEDMQQFQSFVGALSFIAVLLGGIVVANTMIMNVYERTREIGTLRALGWRRRMILSMMLWESLLLSLLSGVAGVLMGVGLCALAGSAPMVGSLLQPSFSPQMFGEAIGLALLLGGLGGLYPAWRASQLSPAEALRYE